MQVYDITDFLADHPGGAKAPMIYAGDDATEEFIMLHKPDIIKKQGRLVFNCSFLLFLHPLRTDST
jgi:cytochrome b involved in lipid metabolism